MNLLVGCPVSHREWILPHWIDHVRVAAERASVGVDFVAVVAEDDQPCIDILADVNADLVIVEAEARADKRTWNLTRYRHMVTLRNTLLDRVRQAAPFYFLSLDSDILLHPDAISSMLDAFVQFPDAWAVGSRCYLSSFDRQHPNMAHWRYGRTSMKFTRRDMDTLVGVDVLMAIKMMTPKAYAVSYSEDRFGEDFGWSRNCQALGGKLYWDGRVINKHVMKREALEKVDIRVGF